MSTMTTVTDVLQGLGAGDSAISYMGPSLTIALSYIAGIAVAQGAKFPLWMLSKDPLHGYLVRVVGVMTAFLFAHYLSNHLSVPMEVFVAVTQPLAFMVLRAAADKWAPWLSQTVFRSVGD